MRILVDLDSTIVDLMSKWLRLHNEAQGDDLTIDRILTWSTHLYAKGGLAVYDVLEQPGVFHDLEPLPGAIEAVKSLHDAGHEIFIVTAASYPSNLSEKAIWCKNNLPFLNKRRIIYAHEKHLITAEAIIDDSYLNAEAYRSTHPNSLVMGIEFPYNVGHVAYDLLAKDWRDPAAAWKQMLEFINKTT